MSEAYVTPNATQVAIACRPEYLNVRAEAGTGGISEELRVRARDAYARLFDARE
jgi:hypothetical protein